MAAVSARPTGGQRRAGLTAAPTSVLQALSPSLNAAVIRSARPPARELISAGQVRGPLLRALGPSLGSCADRGDRGESADQPYAPWARGPGHRRGPAAQRTRRRRHLHCRAPGTHLGTPVI